MSGSNARHGACLRFSLSITSLSPSPLTNPQKKVQIQSLQVGMNMEIIYISPRVYSILEIPIPRGDMAW